MRLSVQACESIPHLSHRNFNLTKLCHIEILTKISRYISMYRGCSRNPLFHRVTHRTHGIAIGILSGSHLSRLRTIGEGGRGFCATCQ